MCRISTSRNHHCSHYYRQAHHCNDHHAGTRSYDQPRFERSARWTEREWLLPKCRCCRLYLRFVVLCYTSVMYASVCRCRKGIYLCGITKWRRCKSRVGRLLIIQCYCSNSIDASSKTADSDCSSRCKADGGFVCGASQRISVYSTTVQLVSGATAPTGSGRKYLWSHMMIGNVSPIRVVAET